MLFSEISEIRGYFFVKLFSFFGRDSFNGRVSAFQADHTGSSFVSRSILEEERNMKKIFLVTLEWNDGPDHFVVRAEEGFDKNEEALRQFTVSMGYPWEEGDEVSAKEISIIDL